MVRHLWPSGDRFVFNCFRHWSSMFLQNGDGMKNILHIREDTTQGDPLDMVA